MIVNQCSISTLVRIGLHFSFTLLSLYILNFSDRNYSCLFFQNEGKAAAVAQQKAAVAQQQDDDDDDEEDDDEEDDEEDDDDDE